MKGNKKALVTFIMPMIVLAIRMEIELIFLNSYSVFFSKDQHREVSTIAPFTNFTIDWHETYQ